MKTLEELFKTTPVFDQYFKNKEDVADEFSGSSYSKEKNSLYSEILAKNILFASYEAGGYEGDAYVIFEEDGKLYLVTGSHCSCYGLEDQWKPEDVSVEYFDHLLSKTKENGYIFQSHPLLINFLTKVEE